MRIDIGIHPNCSEWNSSVEPDYTDIDEGYFYNLFVATKKKEIETEIKGWDK